MKLPTIARRLAQAWLAPRTRSVLLVSAVLGGSVLARGALVRTTSPGPAAPFASVARGVQVGDTVRFKFRQPLLNGRGVTALEDLAGKPLLIEYWGTRCPGCIGAAVPSALKLQETYGDDLQVLFVELQNTGPERVAAFALERRWLGGRALWTSELAVDANISTLPACVLVGSTGRVLLKGSPLTLQKEIERLVQEEIKQLRTPPEDVPTILRPAWLEFHNGRFGSAIDLARTLALRDDLDAAARSAARATEARLRAQLDRRLVRMEWMITNGYLGEALEACEAVRVGVANVDGLSARVEALWARLQAPELRPVREAEVALARLQERLFTSGGDAAVVRELEAFALAHAETCLSQRVRDLVAMGRALASAR